MQLVKVGAAVLNQTPLAWEGNRANIVASIAGRAERRREHSLPARVVHHGLRLRRRFSRAEHAAHGVANAGRDQARKRRGWSSRSACRSRSITCSTTPRACWSMAASPASRPNGSWPATASTTSRAGSSPGRPAARVMFTVEDADYPLGDVYFDCGGVRIGFEICEDAWVANRPGSGLSMEGVDIILNPSASHFAFGKADVRERFVLEGSRAFGVSYVYSNLLGNEAGRAIYDGGALIASAGQMVAAGPRFSFADWRLTTARGRSRRHAAVARRQRQLYAQLRPGRPTSASVCRSAFRSISRGPQRSSTLSGRRASTSRKRSSPARSRWRCSITCARAGRTGLSSR